MELLSQLWSLLGLLTVLQNVLPSQLLSLLHSSWQSLQDTLTPFSYFDVPEFLASSSVEPNPLYRHVTLYLHHSLLLHHTSQPSPRLTLYGGGPLPHSFSLSPSNSVGDRFDNHRLVWTHHADTLNDSLEERRSFTLRLPKTSSPSSLLRSYLRHVTSSAMSFDVSCRDRRIHTNASARAWSSVPFRHPASFETLALDPELKSFLVADLRKFAAAGEFYRRVGRPWKRGYLLYGPPGSGKSSLIAAIANFLNYDVFDLELTRVHSNSDLRSLLIQTTNRSVIVIEDIDCSLDLAGERRRKMEEDDDDDEDGGNNNNSSNNNNKNGRVTLSGLLNFTDGLWSCCGDERVIVFTTNYKEGIDKALLRAGRMDVHVRLGECTPGVMREMVERYAGVGAGEEEIMEEVESLCAAAVHGEGKGKGMTVAEVAEVLMRNRGDQGVVGVRELVKELKRRVGRESGGAGNEEAVEEKRRGWEGKVTVLGRFRSLTKSDSGRRGV